MLEFKECSSEYEVPDKRSSGAISDDGEFQEARQLKLVDDDCTEALIIEVQRENFKNGTKLFPSDAITKEVTEMRRQGVKSSRARGNKHFNKVAYAKGDD